MNLALLKNKNLSLLVFGQLVSQIGSGMQNFAFSLYVLRLTGSASQFASVLAIGMIPKLLLGPICGVFADWFDRKKIIVYLDLISGLLIGGLYLISLKSSLSMLHIYTTVILLSIISSLFNPAISTAIPSVVNKDDLLAANSLNSLITTIGFMTYPMLAGILFGKFGLSIVLLINSLSFLLSAISEMFIDLNSPSKKTQRFSIGGFREDFKAGVTFILNHRLLRKILILVFIANSFLNPSFTVGVIYVANLIIKVSDFQLGALQTMMIIGSMAGSFIAGYVSKRFKLPKIVFCALFLIGLIICFIAINSSQFYINIFNTSLVPYITLTTFALLVACIGTITNIGMSTMLQKETPLDMMGRVISVRDTISMCAIPFGQMLFGIMLDRVAGYIPLLMSGTIIVFAAIIFNYSINRDNYKDTVLKENNTI